MERIILETTSYIFGTIIGAWLFKKSKYNWEKFIFMQITSFIMICGLRLLINKI